MAVGPSVRGLVGRSVGWSVGRSAGRPEIRFGGLSVIGFIFLR